MSKEMLRETPNRDKNIIIDCFNQLSEIVNKSSPIFKRINPNDVNTIAMLEEAWSDLSGAKELFDKFYNYLEQETPKRESHEKAADIGMATIRNEEECIIGWAKTMLYFCNEVYALVDPETSDNTIDILKSAFPQIKILDQDRSLGDSDNETEGKKKALIMHANYNYFINELVDDGEIFLLLSADERFYPPEFPVIEKEIEFMREHEAWNGWFIPQKKMWQFYPDDFHVIDFSGKFALLMQYKFFRKRYGINYEHELSQHSGWNWMDFTPSLKSKANWFHYCFIKNSRPAFGYWRDKKDFRKFPRIQINNPMPNWRTMPELNNKGELIENI